MVLGSSSAHLGGYWHEPLVQGTPLQQSDACAHDWPYALHVPPSGFVFVVVLHVPLVEPGGMLQLPPQQSDVVVHGPEAGLHETGLQTSVPVESGRHLPPQQSLSKAHSPLVGMHAKIPASPPTTWQRGMPSGSSWQWVLSAGSGQQSSRFDEPLQ